MIKKLLFLGLLSCGIVGLQAVTAVGDTPDSATTFSFSVGSAIYNAQYSQLWTLSGQDTSSMSATIQSYGISYTPFIQIDGSSATVLTAYPYLSSQAFVTSTGSEGSLIVPSDPVVNPLLGNAFSGVTYLGSFLTVVNALSSQFVYLIQSVSFDDGASMGTTSPLGLSLINVLDLGSSLAKVIAGSAGSALFIANTEGVFGTASSAISFASTTSTQAVVNGQSTAVTSMVLQADRTILPNTQVLTAGGDALANIGTSVTMYPSPSSVMGMYVGLDVTGVVGSQAVGMFTATAVSATDSVPASITFDSVIPDLVASSGIQTPVSATGARQVVVANITTTSTSTGLSYFITSRYDETGNQSVYAMPMVTMSSNSSDNGKIADFDSIAQVFKIIGVNYRVQGFDTVIDVSDAAQIDIEGTSIVTARLQVGGGSVPIAPGQFIKQLSALGDAVFITIHEASAAGTTPGMFKSQALFDAQGRIMSWTPWQRVAGTDDRILFAVKNRTTDATMYVSGALSNTIQQTVWNNTTDLQAFITKVSGCLPQVNGGVQGLFPFPTTTPGFSNSPTAQVTLLVATGNGSVAIAQTGQLVDTNLEILTQAADTSIVLDASLGLSIGSVVAAEFANDGAGQNWLFMAGSGGLSVLSSLDGSGFVNLPNSAAAASLIADGQTCKTLGTFSFVKKIVSDGNYLYIMTPTAVFQILIDQLKFASPVAMALDPVQIITAAELATNASCTDMLVDQGVVLLGTTSGLYSINITGGIPGVVTPIAIPGGLSCVSRLQATCHNVSFFGTDYGFYGSSNLYVLTINYALQQARLNRFTITAGVVTPIQDQLLEGQNGPLLIFDYMSNNVFIDGSLGFTTSYRMGSIPPAVKYLEYTLQAGRSSAQTLLTGHTANLSILAVVTSLGVTAITRDYASGCLMIAADFGILADS